MNEQQIQQELKHLEMFLFDQSNWQAIELTRDWARAQPKAAGVYVIFENEFPIYVGETACLASRASDMLNSRHHTVRRSIGTKYFSSMSGFEKATSFKKFPDHIEPLVIDKMRSLHICFLEVQLGRKELEEYIQLKHKTELNQRTKRGAKRYLHFTCG